MAASTISAHGVPIESDELIRGRPGGLNEAPPRPNATTLEEESMTSNVAAAAHFVAASVAAFIVSSSAFAEEVAVEKIASAAATPTARSDRAHLHHISADVLKREFLMCERAAARGLLDLATVGACSMLYEELRERVFGGSFDALLTWWGGARQADTETAHTEPAPLR